ncbi:YopX family protein [Streptococcus suis]|uniref:YopX family protein n=2 Tax=Streptococcus suis TaxID=1307 RepID=UPI000CF4B469
MIQRYRAFYEGKMYGVKAVIWTSRGLYVTLDEGNKAGRRVRGAVLMQSTGLFDVNGNAVFEGDVVRWGMHSPGGHELYHRYAKVQIHPDLQFKILFYVDSRNNERKKGDGHIFRYGSFAYRKTELYLEIIGNVWEGGDLIDLSNPEAD